MPPLLQNELSELLAAFDERIYSGEAIVFADFMDEFKRSLLSTVHDHILNVSEAARLLNVKRTTLQVMLQRKGIREPTSMLTPADEGLLEEKTQIKREYHRVKSREAYLRKKLWKQQE